MTEGEKLSHLLVPLSLAFVWAFWTGVFLHRAHPVRPKKHGRLGQSLLVFASRSNFRAGLDRLTLWVLSLWGVGSGKRRRPLEVDPPGGLDVYLGECYNMG